MSSEFFIDVYIGLGSNLSEPIQQLKTARQHIAALDQVQELAFSSLYASPPMGPQDQPDYINAVMGIKTCITALTLLRQLQAIENEQGRIRQRRWGERTLDLDILIYGNHHIQHPDLHIPHLGMHERAFVLYPLAEIAPDLWIPQHGHIDDLTRQCPATDLKKL